MKGIEQLCGGDYQQNKIERLGRGVRMMFAEMEKHNGTEPEIIEEGGEVVVRIKKKPLTPDFE